MRWHLSVGILLVLTSPVFAAPAKVSGKTPGERFQRSVDADIAIAEAEQQGKTDPKSARKLLQFARDLVPEDPEVWYHSARFELDLGNKEGALAHLTQALNRDPSFAAAAYDRAVLLVELGREVDAKAALTAYRAAHPDDSRVAYYLALYAFQAGDNATAKPLFNEARVGDSQIAAYARAYFALIAAQERDADAPKYAAEALKTAPNDLFRTRLAPIAATYTGALDGQTGDAPHKWIDVRGIVATEVDSNAALAPLNASGIDSISPTLAAPVVGLRLMEDVRLTFRPVQSEKITFEVEGAFTNANHVNRRSVLAAYDYASPAGTLRLYSRLGSGLKVDIGIDAMFRALFTNAFGTYFFNGYSGSPYIGLIFAPRHGLYAMGTVEYRDYRSSTVTITRDPQYDRDGMVYSAGLYYTLPFWYFDASLGGGYDQEQARGTEYQLKGGRGQVALRFNYQNTWIVNAYGGVNVRLFPKALAVGDTGTPAGRLEQRYEAGAGLRWNPIPYFGISATYAYTHNDAFTLQNRTAYDLYTYRRHVGALSLIASY